MTARRWTEVLAFAVLLAFGHGVACAQESAPPCVKRVRWEVQPPYGLWLKDGRRGGYYADVVTEALARMGCTAILDEMPWPRGLYELQAGRLDVMAGMLRNEERLTYASFSRGINLSPNLLFLRGEAARQHPIQALADLRDTPLRIAVESGAYYSAEYRALLDDPRFASRLHPIDRLRAWRMLAAGRIDGVISDQASALIEGIPLQPEASGVHPVLVLSSEPARVAFSRRTTDAAFVARFDAAIDAMVADGTLVRLRERYIPCPADPVTLGCASDVFQPVPR